MSEQRVGTCSICGGSVIGFRGAWFSINPPPPDHCSGCGAMAQSDVIKMHPAPHRHVKPGYFVNGFRARSN